MSKKPSNLKDFLLYGGVSKEEYYQIKPLILSSNLKTWRIASIFLEILFLAMFICSILYKPFGGFAPFIGVLAVYTILLVLILLIGLDTSSRLLMPILYLSNIVIISMTLCACVYSNSGIVSHVAFCAVLVSISFFTIDKPYRVTVLVLSSAIAYSICVGIQDYQVIMANQNNAEALQLAQGQMFFDLFLGAIFLIISIFIVFYMHYSSIRHSATLYVTQKERDTDALTGLKNSIAYDRAVDDLTDKIKHRDDFKFAIVLFDINSLKNMNDTYGHSHGDDLIIRTGQTICAAFKSSTIYRIGGDEFVAILVNDDYNNKERLCRDLHEKVEEIHKNAKTPLEDTSFAFGMAVYSRKHDYDYISIFSRADAEMYENKRLIKSKNGTLNQNT